MRQEPVNSILSQISCPHCWHKSKPFEIKWVSAHPSLRDDPKVPDGHRRFLPTRFHVSGQAIDSMGERCSEIACPAMPSGDTSGYRGAARHILFDSWVAQFR